MKKLTQISPKAVDLTGWLTADLWVETRLQKEPSDSTMRRTSVVTSDSTPFQKTWTNWLWRNNMERDISFSSTCNEVQEMNTWMHDYEPVTLELCIPHNETLSILRFSLFCFAISTSGKQLSTTPPPSLNLKINRGSTRASAGAVPFHYLVVFCPFKGGDEWLPRPPWECDHWCPAAFLDSQHPSAVSTETPPAETVTACESQRTPPLTCDRLLFIVSIYWMNIVLRLRP